MELAEKVEERGAPRVAEVLRRLPEGRYETPAEMLDGVRRLDPRNRDVPGEGIRDTGETTRPAG